MPKKLPIAAESSPELLPPPVADDVLQEVVQTLNGIHRDSSFDFARRVGSLILEKFYGGDMTAWRDRGQKDSSFRKLADLEKAGTLKVSASAIYRCVALVELEKRIGVSTWEHLTVSHVRAVFGLPENDQRDLLAKAEQESWTVTEMEKAVAKTREDRNDGRGRPALPAFVKTVHRLQKFLAAGEDAFGDIEQVENLDAEEAQRLYQAVTGMKLKCEELQKALGVKVPGIG